MKLKIKSLIPAITAGFMMIGMLGVQAFATETKYNIQLNYNDGITENETVNISSANELPTPSRDGYIFDDWYIVEKGKITVNKEIKSFTNPNETYSWIMDDDGVWMSGNIGVDSSTSNMISEEFTTVGGTLSFQFKSFGESSYDYLGYDILNVNTGTYLSGYDIPTYESCLNKFQRASEAYSTESYSLPAGTYKLLFMYGKDTSDSDNDDRAYVKNVKISGVEEEGFIPSDDIRPDKFTKDLILMAKWFPIDYTVEYNGNGADDGLMRKSKHIYNIESDLNINMYTKNGDYVFAGWNTKADGSGTKYSDKQPVKNLTNINNETVTLYAQWVEVKDPIKFAVYGVNEDEHYLKFYNRKTVLPSAGDLFDEMTVKEVYTDFENLDITTDNFGDIIPWYSLSLEITHVEVVDEGITPVNTAFWFFGFENCLQFELRKLNTSKVTNMSGMFEYAGYNVPDFELDLSTWVTSNVTDMSYMFSSAGYISERFVIDSLYNWDVSNVTNMEGMFYESGACAEMFYLDLSQWDTSNVTNMADMFQYAGEESFNLELNISNWDTSNVMDMSYMFSECGQDSSFFNIKGLQNLNTSNVKTMKSMFEYAGVNGYEFELDLSEWDTSNVTDMSYMFYGSGIEKLNITSFKTKDVKCYYMFDGMCFLKEIELGEGFDFNGNGDSRQCYLPTPNEIYIPNTKGYWYNKETDEQYLAEEIPNNTSATYMAVEPPEAFAVYSIYGDEHYLKFYNKNYIPKVGEWYDGYTVEEVFTDFETSDYVPWSYLSDRITNVKIIDEDIKPMYTSYWFSGFAHCSSFDLVNLDTSNVIDMREMFSGAGSFVDTLEIDITGWDTSNVTNMSLMFAYAGSAASVLTINGISDLDVSNVMDMSGMFIVGGNNTATLELDLSKWDTSNATNMEWMFGGSGIRKLNISGFDNSNAYCHNMFSESVYLEEITVGDKIIFGEMYKDHWEYPAYVCLDPPSPDFIDGATGIWYNKETSQEYTPIEIPSNTAATYVAAHSNVFAVYSIGNGEDYLKFYNRINVPSVGDVFDNATVQAVYTGFENLEITNDDYWIKKPWNNVCERITYVEVVDEGISPISTAYWFSSFYNVRYIDLSKLDMSNVTSTERMFWACCRNSDEVEIKLDGWNTPNLTNMDGMFVHFGYEIDDIKLDLSDLDTSNVTTMNSMFWCALGTASDVEIDFSNWDVSNTEDMGEMFGEAFTKVFSLNIIGLSEWNTLNVKNMYNMFYYMAPHAHEFNIGDLSDWNVSNVIDMSGMFSLCGTDSYNWNIGDLSNWDVSNVENMNSMFYNGGIRKVDWSIGDLSQWDVSNVTDMGGMFSGAGSDSVVFDVGDLSQWNVSNVVDMNNMFSGAGMDSLYWSVGDLSNWDVSNVKDMSNMFLYAGYESIYSQFGDVTNWDVSSLENASCMFVGFSHNNPILEIDISNWDISNVTNMSYMFCEAGIKKLNISNIDNANIMTEGIVTDANYLEEITVGDKFEFLEIYNEEWEGFFNNYFPTPSSEYIDGAKGVWYNKQTGESFIPSEVPSWVSATYVVIKETIPYTVQHWWQNPNGDPYIQDENNYTLVDTEKLEGMNGQIVTPAVKEYDDFDSPETEEYEISEGETLVINYYYIRSDQNDNGESLPIPTKEGYEFLGWYDNPEFSGEKILNIHENITTSKYYIKWARNATTYVVKHWVENIDANSGSYDEMNYSLKSIETKTGPVEYNVSVNYNNYDGFTAVNDIETFFVPADGSGVVNCYYTRNEYEVELIPGEGVESVQGNGTYKYGDYVMIEAVLKDRYEWNGWTGDLEINNQRYAFEMPAKDIKLIANATLVEKVYAVYSKTDNSLMFYCNSTKPEIGDTYNNRIVTKVYEKFDEIKDINLEDVPWNDKYASSVERVIFVDEIAPLETSYWFYGFENCKLFNLKKLNTSNVTDMRYMFTKAGYNVDELLITGIDSWETDNVDNMYAMFHKAGYNADEFNINVSGWNTRNVTNMSFMFDQAGYNASTWNVGNLSLWKVDNVIKLNGMFNAAAYSADSFDLGDLSRWNVENVNNMSYMFAQSGRNVKTNNESGQKSIIPYDNNSSPWNIGNISNWNVSNVKDMSYMFHSIAKGFDTIELDLSGWATTSLINTNNMFSYSNINKLYLDLFDMSKVVDMDYMFTGCRLLEEISVGDNFEFIGDNGYLPVPNDQYIEGANGKWYNSETGDEFDPKEIPNNTKAIYVAVKTDTSQDPILGPGLYDENDNLIVSWDEAGIDVEKNYTEENYKTSETSGYYVITNTYPTTAKVVLPDSVTFIGNMTFAECTGLTTIEIPNNVTSIGDVAFAGCIGLSSIMIPDGVTSIGDNTFTMCIGLTSVVIPDSVTSIGNSVFAYCGNLTSVIIGGSVTSVGKWMFFECTGLTSVVMPDSITFIGDYAFAYCEGLTSVVIPDSVTSIGEWAFCDCTALTSVEFKDTETWHIGGSEGAKETLISSSDLADKSTAATYLKDTYSEKYWTKQ